MLQLLTYLKKGSDHSVGKFHIIFLSLTTSWET